MDRDELMDALTVALIDRRGAADALEAASQKLYAVDHAVQDLIDQLQPRIEVTKPKPSVYEGGAGIALAKRPEPETPSERVHDALLHAGRRLTTDEIVHITGLGRKQIGPCLGVLVKGGRIRNVGNDTWAAA